ncbi:hypothetical protein PR202_gb11093 [Eleusine coracana subsp. coracana]|uniref:Uncharacterized protein n=1 Tax=Eleusine coracana subsp. coracana TaxID=191504 RepID=A0AAV5EJC4_ELECO|nr:hypothetical protein PR202_gb11093 [Eleusine coracana subsp. coracana]
MDQSRAIPPWVMLNNNVDLSSYLPDARDQDWAEIKCSTRKAYGCGDRGQKISAPATTSPSPNSGTTTGIRATGVVHPATDDNLVVLTVDFFYHTFYLVYDAGASSLFMVPHLPPDNPQMAAPIPMRGSGGSDDGCYELVLAASILQVETALKQRRRVFDDAICVWDLAAAAEDDSEFGRLCHYNTSQPIILPSGFFKDLRPLRLLN